MAYATANPPRLISQGAGASTGSLWHYTDGDPIATVIGADYFSDGTALGMKVNDTVIVTDETLGQVVPDCIVSVATAGGASTITHRIASTSEIVIADIVITADESGKTFYLSRFGGVQCTLPAPFLGARFKFVIETAPTWGGGYTIITDSGADIMIGGINELEVDTSSDGPYDANADKFIFAANVAIVGDYVEFESDGTSWFYHGQTNADGGVTTATT